MAPRTDAGLTNPCYVRRRFFFFFRLFSPGARPETRGKVAKGQEPGGQQQRRPATQPERAQAVGRARQRRAQHGGGRGGTSAGTGTSAKCQSSNSSNSTSTNSSRRRGGGRGRPGSPDGGGGSASCFGGCRGGGDGGGGARRGPACRRPGCWGSTGASGNSVVERCLQAVCSRGPCRSWLS